MKNMVSQSTSLTSKQALRVAHCLCNYYSIPALGDQLIALVGDGYEHKNIKAMQNWIQKRVSKVRNQSDIAEWAALLKSELEIYGIELLD